MTDDLITWLRAQLDDDERLIDRNSGDKGLMDVGSYPDYRTYDGEDQEAADAFLSEFSPKRMRAEVDAKRRILDEHNDPISNGRTYRPEGEQTVCGTCLEFGRLDEHQLWPCTTLRLLALPYADRPGYRSEWAP